jgi:phosphomannomutase/phosphoglucomutase
LQSRPHAMRLFGTSGIRGYVNRDLSPEFAVKMGLCFAQLLGREGEVAVGMDVRLHAPVIQHAAVAGLIAGGLVVHDCGVAPTPAVLHYMKRHRLGGAVLVTGSHTIPPVIGLLFFQKDGGEISVKWQWKLESLYFRGEAQANPWNRTGRVETCDAIPDYTEAVFRQARSGALEGRRLTVDAGNGAASGIIGPLLSGLGCKVSTINDRPDGRFSSRPPYPRREVLGSLARAVREGSAELGVATDGDGDRAIFVDEKGKVVWGDVAGALFVDDLLGGSKREKVVAPVNSSELIKDVCAGRGRIITTRVGPPAIIDALRSHKDAVFGFEETGKYIWPGVLLYGDVAISTVKMLELMDRRGMSMRALESTLPRYQMSKRAFRCAEPDKAPLLANVLKLARQEDARVVTIDGVKVVYADRSWILLRPSGTEPFFRCYVEAKSGARAAELAKHGVNLLREASSTPTPTAR